LDRRPEGVDQSWYRLPYEPPGSVVERDGLFQRLELDVAARMSPANIEFRQFRLGC
jgi:hypothetical protein